MPISCCSLGTRALISAAKASRHLSKPCSVVMASTVCNRALRPSVDSETESSSSSSSTSSFGGAASAFSSSKVSSLGGAASSLVGAASWGGGAASSFSPWSGGAASAFIICCCCAGNAACAWSCTGGAASALACSSGGIASSFTSVARSALGTRTRVPSKRIGSQVPPSTQSQPSPMSLPWIVEPQVLLTVSWRSCRFLVLRCLIPSLRASSPLLSKKYSWAASGLSCTSTWMPCNFIGMYEPSAELWTQPPPTSMPRTKVSQRVPAVGCGSSKLLVFLCRIPLVVARSPLLSAKNTLSSPCDEAK
mmetsp:Transcript_130990/g.326817  ORF Transcript_130990/g.326817 Transcript_130990/m.326817 type:complete len:306 (+) Transcript_130990:541-1458(+)